MKPEYEGGGNILTKILTMQTLDFTMTQNLLNRVHSISSNHLNFIVATGIK